MFYCNTEHRNKGQTTAVMSLLDQQQLSCPLLKKKDTDQGQTTFLTEQNRKTGKMLLLIKHPKKDKCNAKEAENAKAKFILLIYTLQSHC